MKKCLKFLLSSILAAVASLPAQTLFDSGSDGTDGALIFEQPPSARNGLGFSYHGGLQKIFAFGGFDNAGARLNDTWSYDGTSWKVEQPVFVPDLRNSLAMAYDSTRNVLLMYGGSNPTNISVATETWQFETDRWVLKTPANNPGTENNRTMVFDESRQVAVMFGGIGPIDETWEYSGTDWTQIVTTNKPSARRLGGFAYDSDRNVCVLFGGQGASGLLSDTWEYDGNDWTPRFGGHMTYDQNRSKMVLFGGDDGIFKADTWEYNGTNWTLVPTANAPSPRVFGGTSYDSLRQRTVLFGGIINGDRSAETWDYDGVNWVVNSSQNASPVIDMSAHPDGVYNYTRVSVGKGVNLSFASNTNNTPVVWLVGGDVAIDGAVTLSGKDGGAVLQPGMRPAGGPGGYAGGMGGVATSENMKSGEPGLGPGGGKPGLIENEDGGGAGFAVAGTGPLGGSAYGNPLNSPIIGGSGGGGGAAGPTNNGGNGGGAGGAILIAATGKISLNGSILAAGGAGQVVATAGNGGAGSGGAVRLVANRVEGSGAVDAGTTGRIRVEGFFVTLNGAFSPTESKAPPYALDLAGQGAIVITDIDGSVQTYNVPANPGGDLNNPDVIFSESGPVTINMSTTNVPQGTVIDVRITSGSTVIQVQSAGVAANGAASVTANVPAGVGTIQAFAEYTQ
jgi:hypothetical protein